MSEPLSEARAQAIRDAVREKYRAVSCDPGGHFPYPIGRQSALGLGYDAAALDRVPRSVVDRFVGVGNPLGVRELLVGDRVLDLGCGYGLDVFVASMSVSPGGRAVGVDLTPEMIEGARCAAGDWRSGSVAFVVGSVERLPFDDDTFDVVISNGALNLVPDKHAVCRETFRVLRPGGTFASADLLVTEAIPEELLSSMDAWST